MSGILVVAFALLGTIVGRGIAAAPVVTWADGAVTADFQDVPVEEAVAALSRATGVEFRGELQDRHDIYARFERARFGEVVDRLVGEQNFTIVYDAGGRPRRVDLLGMPQRPPAAQGSPTGFGNLVNSYGRVSLPPLLATALGKQRGELPWVLRRGLRHRDPAVGTAAVSLFVRTVEAEPALHGALLRADDRRLTHILRIWSGQGLERLLTGFVEEARDPLLRSRGRRLQQQLVSGANAPAT